MSSLQGQPIQEPAQWSYTIDATGNSLATYPGNVAASFSAFLLNGLPFMSAPVGTTQGPFTIVGTNAALHISPDAIEATIVGQGAGGSGLNGGPGGTGLTGPECTFIGWHSGSQMTTGQFNTGVGVNTLGFDTTGSNNVAVGTDAMRNPPDIVNSVAIGVNALHSGGSGITANVAIGQGVMQGAVDNSSVPSNNVAIGAASMSSLSMASPINNVMVGNNTGASITTGQGNVGVGLSACNKITVTTDNTGLGTLALQALTGSQNTAVGSNALSGTGSGNTNTALGYHAGSKITSGGTNVIIGPSVASTTLTTGSGNILIGASAAIDASAAAAGAEFHLGNHATNLMRATGINSATPAFFLDWLPASTTFANDAAAATGGVAIGQIYRNGSVVMCRIV